MLGWLIYDSENAEVNKSYIEWFQHEAKKQGIDLQLIIRERLAVGIEHGSYQFYLNDKLVSLPNFVVIRTIEPILQHIFETLTIPSFNEAYVAEICNHKSKTYIELNRLNIPMMATYFATKQAPPATLPLSFPFVVKEATGRSGKQIYYCKTLNDWKHALQSLSTNDFLIQAADVQLGKDVRVFVIGKEIISAVLRVNEKDFRANYKLGGKAVPFTLTESQKKMIQKIIDHFDFGLVGIDFLIGHDGELIFNEIEDVVGSRTLSEISDINLIEKYVTFIKTKVAEHILLEK